MPHDRIHISDLRLDALIGIKPAERTHWQDIIVNVTLEVDTTKAAGSDRVADAVDYSIVAEDIRRHVASAKRYLLEALAADIARICLSRHGVISAKVRVDKPSALSAAGKVGIEIERRPEDYA